MASQFTSSELTDNDVLTSAKIFFEKNKRLPSNKTKSEVPGLPNRTWDAIDQAGRKVLSGLSGSLSQILKPLREELKIESSADKAKLSLTQIIQASECYYLQNGSFPHHGFTDPVPGLPNESWSSIATALRFGYRGLPKSGGLSQLLKPLRQKYGVIHTVDKRQLSHAKILRAAKKFYRIHKRIPHHATLEAVPGLLGESWTAIDQALRNGSRKLPLIEGGLSSLLAPLREQYGTNIPKKSGRLIIQRNNQVANQNQDLSSEFPALDEILTAATTYYKMNKKLPTLDTTDPVPGFPNESWMRINEKLRKLRSDDESFKHGSLAILLTPLRAKFGIMRAADKSPLTEELIIDAARKFYEIHAKLPVSNSPEPVPGLPNETWIGIAQALKGKKNGALRGLSSKKSLFTLLKPLRDEYQILSVLDKEDLSEQRVICAIRTYYEENCKWPSQKTTAAVPGFPNESWSIIDQAGRKGRRGLNRTLFELVSCLKANAEKTREYCLRTLPPEFRQTPIAKAIETTSLLKKETPVINRKVAKKRFTKPLAFIKGEAFEQLAGVLLQVENPNEMVIGQYCLVVQPPYFGMRADYKVGDKIVEVKWGNYEKDIHNTVRKHAEQLGNLDNYEVLLAQNGVNMPEVAHSIFENRCAALDSRIRKQLNIVYNKLEKLALNGDKDALSNLRDYLYLSVDSANKQNGSDRIEYLIERLELLSGIIDWSKLDTSLLATISSNEAIFEYEGRFYRGFIQIPEYTAENTELEIKYQFGSRFYSQDDFRLAVLFECSEEANGKPVEIYSDNFGETLVIDLENGKRLSTTGVAESVKVELLDIKRNLRFTEDNFKFAVEFIDYCEREYFYS